MSASDHLSPQQFMPMGKVDDLDSSEGVEQFGPHTMHEFADNAPMSEHHAADSLSWFRNNWDKARQDPITVFRPKGGIPLRVKDGHHRYLMAQEKGEQGMLVRYHERP